MPGTVQAEPGLRWLPLGQSQNRSSCCVLRCHRDSALSSGHLAPPGTLQHPAKMSDSDSSLDSELLKVAGGRRGKGAGKKRKALSESEEEEDESSEDVSLDDESDWDDKRTTRQACRRWGAAGGATGCPRRRHRSQAVAIAGAGQCHARPTLAAAAAAACRCLCRLLPTLTAVLHTAAAAPRRRRVASHPSLRASGRRGAGPPRAPRRQKTRRRRTTTITTARRAPAGRGASRAAALRMTRTGWR